MTDFSRPQIKAIKKLAAHPPNTSGCGKAERFLLQFIFLEALMRLLGRYYRERTNQKKKLAGFEPLKIDVVKRTFAHFQISVSDQLLHNVLDSKLNRRGGKSARNLRNALVHNWAFADISEVNSRFDSLMKEISIVVDKIGTKAGKQ